jgi:hypothetical protein
MRKIDATKIGDAMLVQIAVRDMMINILDNDVDSRLAVLAQLDTMRDREDLITRSGKQGLILDERLTSDEFLLSVKSELEVIVDRLRREQQYDIATTHR